MDRVDKGKTWDAWAAVLLMAALLTVSIRLALTEWTDHLVVTSLLVLLGAALGLALGTSRFPLWGATFLALAYGAVVVPWNVGLTLRREMAWGDRWREIAHRLDLSLARFVGGEPVYDPMFFLVLVGALSWSMGVHAGYALARRASPWRAILPPGLALLVVQVYDPVPPRTGYLVAYLFFSLLLVAHTTYLRRLVGWRRAGASVPFYAGYSLNRIALAVVAVLLLMAWTAPGLTRALPPAEQVWDGLSRAWDPIYDHLNRAFAALRGSTGLAVESYGPYLALGRGRRLGTAPLMRVQAPPPPGPGVRYYWRARTYDHYAAGTWRNTVTDTVPLTPTLLARSLPGVEGRWTATFTITPLVPVMTLFTPAGPVWVSPPAEAVLARNPDGTADLIALQAVPYLRAGSSYRVRASLSDPTVAQLREAGEEYPDWVVERYLQLPPGITPRTRELAHRIAAGRETPYDVAEAVTRYLRATIRYTETVPPLPPGQDPVDWFLFDLREGFCTYYATAEVVLLRAVGVPARLAVGYATGERQGPGIYQVRRRDSHAWPEVYFPGIGWVEFEPTGSQPAIRRPVGSVGEGGGRPPSRPEVDEERWRELGPFPAMEEMMAAGERTAAGSIGPYRRLTPRPKWFLVLLSVLLFFSVGWILRRRIAWRPLPVMLEAGLDRAGLPVPTPLRRWAWRARLPPLLWAYGEINRALVRLGVPPAPAETPAERVARLARVLPPAAPYLRSLLAEYQTALYSPRSGNLWAARQAGRAVRFLSWKARLRRLWLWKREKREN